MRRNVRTRANTHTHEREPYTHNEWGYDCVYDSVARSCGGLVALLASSSNQEVSRPIAGPIKHARARRECVRYVIYYVCVFSSSSVFVFCFFVFLFVYFIFSSKVFGRKNRRGGRLCAGRGRERKYYRRYYKSLFLARAKRTGTANIAPKAQLCFV